MSYEFKVGDRVVCVHYEGYTGRTGTVNSIIPTNSHHLYAQIRVLFDNGEIMQGIFEYRYELELVYNSPLREALREEQ